MKLLDGGCADSIPVQNISEGWDMTEIVVVLTQRRRLLSKKPQNTAMAELRYHKYPRICRDTERTDISYIIRLWKKFRELEKAG